MRLPAGVASRGPWSCSGQRYAVPELGVNWPSCVFLPTMARGKREARKALDIPRPAPRPAPTPPGTGPTRPAPFTGHRDTHRPQNGAAAWWASSALPVCLWRRGRLPCHSPGAPAGPTTQDCWPLAGRQDNATCGSRARRGEGGRWGLSSAAE